MNRTIKLTILISSIIFTNSTNPMRVALRAYNKLSQPRLDHLRPALVSSVLPSRSYYNFKRTLPIKTVGTSLNNKSILKFTSPLACTDTSPKRYFSDDFYLGFFCGLGIGCAMGGSSKNGCLVAFDNDFLTGCGVGMGLGCSIRGLNKRGASLETHSSILRAENSEQIPTASIVIADKEELTKPS